MQISHKKRNKNLQNNESIHSKVKPQNTKVNTKNSSSISTFPKPKITATLLKQRNIQNKNLTELRVKHNHTKSKNIEPSIKQQILEDHEKPTEKKLTVHRTSIVLNKKPQLPKPEIEVHPTYYYLKTEESVENGGQNSEQKKKKKYAVKHKAHHTESKLGGVRESTMSSSISSYTQNSPRFREYPISSQKHYHQTTHIEQTQKYDSVDEKHAKEKSLVRDNSNFMKTEKKKASNLNGVLTGIKQKNNVFQSNSKIYKVKDEVSNTFIFKKKADKCKADDFFEYDEIKGAELLQDEKEKYGDRTPKGYKKVKLLGK